MFKFLKDKIKDAISKVSERFKKETEEATEKRVEGSETEDLSTQSLPTQSEAADIKIIKETIKEDIKEIRKDIEEVKQTQSTEKLEKDISHLKQEVDAA